MKDLFIIIDGNSLMNRAYYAVRNPMITKEGLYTQGIYGFLNMLFKVQKEYEPKYMAVAWDMKTPTFRHKAYSEYKAGRKKMPEELAMEFPYIKEILEALKIKNIEVEGFEADDIIGTIAKNCSSKKLENLIITGDKDSLQLISDYTKILFTKRGVSNFTIYDEKTFQEEYKILTSQFVDLKAIMGDKSDNIPGIPGIGQVKGTSLILEFGSLENLLKNASNIKNQKLRNTVEENIQQAILSESLAEINCNIPLDLELADFSLQKPDYQKLISLYKKLEFNSFLKKIAKEDNKSLDSLGIENQLEINSVNIDKVKITKITSKKDLESLEILKGFDKVYIDVESNESHLEIPDITKIKIFAKGNIDKKNFAQDLYFELEFKEANYNFLNMIDDEDQKSNLLGEDKEGTLHLVDVIELFNKLNLNISGINMIKVIYPLIFNGLSNFRLIDDIALLAYLLEPSKKEYSIDTLYLEYFQKEIKKTDDDKKNNIEYFVALYNLELLLKEKLKNLDMEEVYKEAELPLVEVIAAMEVSGIKGDKGVFQKLGKELEAKLDILSSRIYEEAGEEFNINSPKQLGDILFEKLRLKGSKKTKRGYSTSADVLEKFQGESPIISDILEYRTMQKLNSTYINSMIKLIGFDKKIRAHFMQTVTATGRLSCTDPNLQNIPIKLEEGRKVRKGFLPSSDNNVFLGADYSQIELRVLAHLSDDPILINAFKNNADIHRTTASEVFGVPYDEVKTIERSNAKAVNFGIIYGMSSYGLSKELGIPVKEAENYINSYFNKYKKVKEYIDKEVAFCKKHGYTKTLLGRIRYIREISSPNYITRQQGERLAMNSPIQGSAADIMKLAMNKVYNSLKEGGFKAKLILQIHDELIIDCPKEEIEAVSKLLQNDMENVIKLKVPLVAEVNTGNNWYELK